MDVLRQRAAEPKLQPNTRVHSTHNASGARIYLQCKCVLKVKNDIQTEQFDLSESGDVLCSFGLVCSDPIWTKLHQKIVHAELILQLTCKVFVTGAERRSEHDGCS